MLQILVIPALRSQLERKLCCVQVCDYGKLKDFLRAVKSKDVTLMTEEGARHELFMSPDRDRVLHSMIDWLTR